MHCETTLHDYFSTNEYYCHSCFKQLKEYVKQETESCCETHNILNESETLVWGNCGRVEGYKIVNEYLNFYENLHKIKKKSVYQRKYHIENTLADICSKNIIDLSPINKQKIFQIFEIIPQVNKERKRMINVKFVLKHNNISLPVKNIWFVFLKKHVIFAYLCDFVTKFSYAGTQLLLAWSTWRYLSMCGILKSLVKDQNILKVPWFVLFLYNKTLIQNSFVQCTW